jgi:hypothetical protein
MQSGRYPGALNVSKGGHWSASSQPAKASVVEALNRRGLWADIQDTSATVRTEKRRSFLPNERVVRRARLEANLAELLLNDRLQ